MAQSSAARLHVHVFRPHIYSVGRSWIAARAAAQSAPQSVDVALSGRCDQGGEAAHAPVGRRAALWTAAVVGGAFCATPGALAEEMAQAQIEGRSLEVAQRLEQLQVRCPHCRVGVRRTSAVPFTSALAHPLCVYAPRPHQQRGVG